jgi:hypothetical protein
MGKRFAIVIGVAAAGVMALGAQTAAAAAAGPVDSVPPDLQLSGPKKQKLSPASCEGALNCRSSAQVKASCGHEACTLSAEGKLTKVKKDKPLKPASADLEGCTDRCGQNRATLGLVLSPSTRKKALKAIDEGKKVHAKVTVEATDAAGNVATAKRTIRLVKGRR